MGDLGSNKSRVNIFLRFEETFAHDKRNRWVVTSRSGMIKLNIFSVTSYNKQFIHWLVALNKLTEIIDIGKLLLAESFTELF